MAQAHFHLRCCSSHAFSRHDYEQVIVAVTESLRFMPKIANTKSPNKSAVVWGIWDRHAYVKTVVSDVQEVQRKAREVRAVS